MKTTLSAFVLLSLAASGFAQDAQPDTASSAAASQESGTTSPYIIFSNLGSSDERYSDFYFDVAGRSVTGQTETWNAVLFIPKVDVYAKELFLALTYVSGKKLVDIGIYNDNGIGSVGTPVPGGQGRAAQIPDAGTCCRLTKVTLPGDGVLLTGGTHYWLVCNPDATAPSFHGHLHLSNWAIFAGDLPPSPWDTNPGQWPAGEIRGVKAPPGNLGERSPSRPDEQASSGKVTIFDNLGFTSTNRFDYFHGVPLYGDNVPPLPELWEALRFTASQSAHAETLAAAISWISGTKKINLALYSDEGGNVGAPLPGGQGSTTEIPTFQDCCDLTEVTLPAPGVSLTKGTAYWLVATTDDEGAPDFEGVWSASNLAVSAYREPELGINWTSFSGDWLAAKIQGTSP